MNRLLILASVGAAALALGSAAQAAPWRSDAYYAHHHHARHYRRVRHARAAEMEGRETAALVGRDEALNPYGPNLIVGRPVPDTPANRDRFGGPMSLSGQRTAPVGD